MNFFDNLQTNANKLGKTENGANTLHSTLNANVDLFGKSLRFLDTWDIQKIFKEAFNENPKLALKNYFNLLDIRSGKGERKASEVITKQLVAALKLNRKQQDEFLKIIVELGRWDYIFWCLDAYYEAVLGIIINEMETKEISLLAKWLPSINSKKESKRNIAKVLACYFYSGEMINTLSQVEKQTAYKEYRKFLTNWRAKLPLLVEKEMSEQNFSKIPYEKVPSKANLKYNNAFLRHDKERREEFLNKVIKGETKINQSVSYPYELIAKFLKFNCYSTGFGWNYVLEGNPTAFNAYWPNLKQINLPKGNILVVTDTSGSMDGLPMQNSVSLGLYIAERNHGIFKDKIITFSENPKFIDLSKYETPFEKAEAIYTGECPANTDILATMKLIANSMASLSLEERKKSAPTTLLILTDMQFDRGINKYNETIHNEIESEFTKLSVNVPKIIYWNLNAYSNMPVEYNKYGVAIISGFSQNILTSLHDLKNITPEGVMLKTLEKYDTYLDRLNLVLKEKTNFNYTKIVPLRNVKPLPKKAIYHKIKRSDSDNVWRKPNHKQKGKPVSSKRFK